MPPLVLILSLMNNMLNTQSNLIHGSLNSAVLEALTLTRVYPSAEQIGMRDAQSRSCTFTCPDYSSLYWADVKRTPRIPFPPLVSATPQIRSEVKQKKRGEWRGVGGLQWVSFIIPDCCVSWQVPLYVAGWGRGRQKENKKLQRDRKGEEEGRMFFFLGIPQGLLNWPLSQTGWCLSDCIMIMISVWSAQTVFQKHIYVGSGFTISQSLVFLWLTDISDCVLPSKSFIFVTLFFNGEHKTLPIVKIFFIGKRSVFLDLFLLSLTK